MQYLLAASSGSTEDGSQLVDALPSFIQLASTKGGVALFATPGEEALPVRPGLSYVSLVLATLLESGSRYPPALALAREDVAALPPATRRTVDDFTREYSMAIESHLRSQVTDRFLLAKARRDDLGYLEAGAYYWIIGRKPPSTESDSMQKWCEWVSSDYHIYVNLEEDFVIEPVGPLKA